MKTTMEMRVQTEVWHEVCQINDIPEDGGACVLLDGEQIAIFKFSRRNQLYATQNMCPHKKQMVLSRGMIGSHQSEPKVACPFHKKTYSLETGSCFTDTDLSIKTYQVKMEGESVFIKK